MNAGKAVYGILSANSGVTDIVGTRIFPEIAEQEAVTPFVIYQLQSVAPEDTHDGPSKLDEVRFEFLCYADSYNEAADLGVAVRAALDRVSGTYNGVNVESVQFNDVDVEIEYDPRRYSQVLKFTFRIKRDDIEIALGTPVTGAELGDLSDVDVSGVTNGQLIAYNSTTGNWEAADDAGGAEQLNDLTDVNLGLLEDREVLMYDGQEWVNDTVHKSDIGLGNVDNTSDDDKPVSTATQTALNAKADTSAVPSALNDLSDVTIAGTPTGNQALIFDGAANVFKSLPNFTNRFEDEAEVNKQAITPFAERVYTVKADGDGIFIDPESDTPTAGKVIKRKIYQKAGFLESGAVIGDFTLIHTFADDTAYSATESTFEGFRDGDTYGTPPFTLIQTWEEVTAAPSFTGLLNESYGSGAEAAYSTRRLNGNVTDCMVIRRASDSTTQTIGFDGSGNIDEAAIETFCSGTSCTVYQWLDQSGNGNTATAPSTGAEPTIYTGGALVKEGGKVAVQFDGSDDILYNTVAQNSFEGTAQQFTMLHVAQTSDTSSFQYTFSLLDGANSTLAQNDQIGILAANDNKSGAFIRDFSTSTTSLPKSSAAVGTAQHLNTAISTGSNLSVYANGTAGDSVSISYPALAFDYASVGGRYGGSTPSSDTLWSGNIQEVIAYASNKSSVRTDIEENIGDYFTQNTPLLDTYSGAAAAYSLRLLDSTYTGALINVWNGTSYADIYPNVFGELDTVALAAHCGSNDGFIRYWYDQSSNSNDATQTTTANMPKIYDGTTGVVTEGSKPAMTFDGGYLNTSSITSQSVFMAINTTSIPQVNGGWLGQQSGSDQFGITSAGSVRYRVSSNNYDHSSLTTIGYFLNTYTISSSNSLNVYQSGTIATESPTAVSGVASFNRLMSRENNRQVYGNLQEIVIYSSDKSTDRTNIEDNINTFYSIY